MANLAIKGHESRGQEVIEILKMLGGNSRHNIMGDETLSAYYVNNGIICWKHYTYFDDYIIFGLEEFLEKFPCKVGDKVIANGKTVSEVTNMYWSVDKVVYEGNGGGIVWKYDSSKLQPFTEQKEESMEETIKIDIPKGYKFAGINDDNQQVVFEKISSQYPKTYEECCNVLGIIFDEPVDEEDSIGGVITSYEYMLDEKLWVLRKLLICRDAYWKIAGDWKPDWTAHDVKYCLYNEENIVVASEVYYNNYILAFPTEEIREDFYENFKELILAVKELL